MRFQSAMLTIAAAAGTLFGAAGAAHAVESPTVYLREGGEPGQGAVTSWSIGGRSTDQHLLCDWDGDGTATLGLYRSATATWFITNQAGSGGTLTAHTYGTAGAGDQAFCGDWDGDGTETFGIFRTSTNVWHLRNSNTGGVADHAYRFGRPGSGDTPLAGDWNADGIDTPGIYRSSNNVWYLTNRTGVGGIAEISLVYGRLGMGDTPLAGDWDGDGRATPGIFRKSDRSWHLRNTNTSGVADWTYSFGRPTDIALAGDWDGDGRDEPALSRMPGTSPTPTGVDQLIAQLSVAPEGARTGYDRSLFPHWTTTDGCTTRHRVLIAEAVTLTSPDCPPAGTWHSLYDGVTTSDSSTFDIDHMVPLAEAWDSGAIAWTLDQRRAFANDFGYAGSLIAVSASSNRSKGDRDPAEWQPPEVAFHCTYATDWVNVKVRWDLTADSSEHAALRSMLSACPGGNPSPSTR